MALVGLFTAAPAFAHGDIRIPAGTPLVISVVTDVRSSTAQPGDEFRATVTTPLDIAGETVIPASSTVIGRVDNVVSARAWGQQSGVRLRIDRITSPAGASIDVAGDLTTLAGTTLTTVDNLSRGAQLQFRFSQPVVVSESFYMGGGGDQTGDQGQGSDVFATPATITQVQSLLTDLGYYNGQINGRVNPRTREAVSAFQRDQRLTVTGFLDRATLDRLGLISQGGGEVALVNVVSADAATHQGNQLHIRIVTQGASNVQLFEDHFRRGDVMHVYVRGHRAAVGARATNELNVILQPDEWRGVTSIVVHGTGQPITIRSTDVRSGRVLTPQEAAALDAQISSMLNDYARVLGVQYNRITGQLQFTSFNYRENEVELLFTLNSLASASRLYSQLVRSTNDPQALEGATDVFVAQANAVEQAVGRTRSGRARATIAAWQNLRDDFERLDNRNDSDFRAAPSYR